MCPHASHAPRAATRPLSHPPAPPAGYYSRYAALRTLLLQFLALESGQGGSCRGAAAAAPPSGAEQAAAAAAATAARPAGAAGAAPAANSPQQQGQQRQQQQGGGAAPPPQHPHEQLQDRQPAAAPPRRLKQVLVLGAGYDTAFFQLAAEGGAGRLVCGNRLPAGGWVGRGGCPGGTRGCKEEQGGAVLAPPQFGLTRAWPPGPAAPPTAQVAQKKAAAIRQLPDLLACVGGEATAASISPGAVLRLLRLLACAAVQCTAACAPAGASPPVDPASPAPCRGGSGGHRPLLPAACRPSRARAAGGGAGGGRTGPSAAHVCAVRVRACLPPPAAQR